MFRYQADNVYALNTVYFLCAVIGVFTVSNLLVRFSPDLVKRTRVWRATTSVSRYMAYRGYRFPVVRYWSPSLGVIVLGLVGAVFFFGTAGLQMGWHQKANRDTAMTLGPTPYYWPTDSNYGSSPPLATRAGWMALGLLPFVL
jgi:ferric-chelate reductase